MIIFNVISTILFLLFASISGLLNICIFRKDPREKLETAYIRWDDDPKTVLNRITHLSAKDMLEKATNRINELLAIINKDTTFNHYLSNKAKECIAPLFAATENYKHVCWFWLYRRKKFTHFWK